jgi:formylglycine-generating enzyme required for sulfatase activity
MKKKGMRRKTSLITIITALLIISFAPYTCLAYSGGSGDPNTPYQIVDVNDLLALAADTNDYGKCFILMADIDLDPNLPGGQVFTTAIIAADIDSSSGFQGTPFTGTFDGNNHKIINLTINGGAFLGLFGLINSGGSVKNLSLENFTVNGSSGNMPVGGLVGENNGSINNCYSTGSVSDSSNSWYVGGLAGWNNGSISNCFSTSTVSGGYLYVGGLVGYNYYGSISNCYSTGTVSGSSFVGGLAGWNGGGISNCYSTGSVSGASSSFRVGGLVGENDGNISVCYSAGSVSGTSSVGGLVGYTRYDMGLGSVNGCFWDINTSGQTISSGGTGITTTQMKTLSTFTSAGWDFTNETANGTNDYWRMCVDEVNYPHLNWESIAGDFTCPDGVNIEDLSYFVQRWLESDCTYANNNDCKGTDMDASGTVDFKDFAIFASQWLTGSGITPPPSPDVNMVLIPAGTFQMGDSLDGESDALPVHTVTLSSFSIAKYDITNQQYCSFLNSAAVKVVSGRVYASTDSNNRYPYCDTSAAGTDRQIAYSGGVFSVLTKGSRNMVNDPMVWVSWYGAVAYCNWWSQQEGRGQCYNLSTWDCNFSNNGYHLPTEAQWEYAARGGHSGNRFPWGDVNTISHNQANYYNSAGDYSYDLGPPWGYDRTWADGIYPYTSPVGSFAANSYGLYDMAGNVFQWCNDWNGSYRSDSQTNPIGPTSGGYRVLRGGSWYYSAYDCRVAFRHNIQDGRPSTRSVFSGFRVSLGLN